MKIKKLIILVVLLSLWGGSMIFADAVSHKIKVTVNGSALSDQGVIVDGTTYLPLRQLADKFHALITWDDNNKQVNIHKPNIHMMTMSGTIPFQTVRKGSTVTLQVAAQGDSLTTPISGVKIVIVDVNGSDKLLHEEEVARHRDTYAFQLLTKETKYKFNHEGEYKVRMYMKPAKGGDWMLVSEKLIFSES